MLYVD